MYNINTILKKEQEIKNKIYDALMIAKKKQISTEIFVNNTFGINTSVRNQKIELIEFNKNFFLYINVYYKNRKGSSSSTDSSLSSIKKTIESAFDIAKYSYVDKFCGLPNKNLLAFKPKILSILNVSNIDLKQSIKIAMDTEQSSLDYDKKKIYSEGSNFSYYVTIKAIGNSLGMLQSYCSSIYSLYNGVIAKKNNEMQSGYYFSTNRNFKKLKNPRYIGVKSAKNALKRLSPKKIKTTFLPILLSKKIANSLFSHLSDAISGKQIYNKSSFLLNSMNTKILPSWCFIVEKPHIKEGIGSKPFDLEGVSTKVRVIVDKGILTTWITDNYSSNQLNIENTGNAGGIHNWIIQDIYNNYNCDDLLRSMKKGILVTELMGCGVNIINGDYSRGVSGFFVKNGKVQFPVDEITISGNLKNMFNNIQAISNEKNYDCKIQCGSILLNNMNISGI